MEEESIAMSDPQETVLNIDPEAVDADWNSAPDDKLGADGYEEEQDGDDEPEADAAGRSGMTDSGSDQSFTLKHLSEVRTVGRDEVITLAQKGLDYDRIRGKYDAAVAELSRSVRTSQDRSVPTDAAAEKRQTEIREFLVEYGTGIDPRSIPQEVWQSVSKGRTLLAAYQSWELNKLRAESGAARKNTENKTRSAGSRFSAGSVRPRDAIADDWYEGV
jgi:hypothetical protein